METGKLKAYLLEQHTPATVKIYLHDIELFLLYLSEEKARAATYRDVLPYVDYLRKKYPNPRTVSRTIYSIKAYYFWLIATGQRDGHPCRYLNLKDAKDLPVQLQDLFTAEELELLLQREERYEAAKVKNQVIISLLVYQALKLSELVGLKTDDVDLQQGTVYVGETPKSNSRTLSLKPKQVMLFYEYIHQVRPRLLKNETEYLLVNLRGQRESGEGVMYLVETFKPLFPERNLNPTTIRQSVLANMLKAGKDLRVVQAFAGHRKPGTTEKYRQTGLEELKAVIAKYHPLQ
ncbi:tyrosine-type recombinase/integrase [Rufibacter quisquiliarum]|uniref:Integrase/recombinase XerD n=1 Tax=Rufibacter quisquiliarum TaxID=1549639 RepID=A0A839GJY8_9BACT|nr:tyrosine-type recombinase/integrase [Rufibacter quisquiliarum]MBA9077099.1 integrase/recombinase XerD [Rufibacter quisquiliarum]